MGHSATLPRTVKGRAIAAAIAAVGPGASLADVRQRLATDGVTLNAKTYYRYRAILFGPRRPVTADDVILCSDLCHIGALQGLARLVGWEHLRRLVWFAERTVGE